MIAGLLLAMADHQSSNQNRVIHAQQWKCDVCQVAIFPTLQEACHHEEKCKKSKADKVSTNPMIPRATGAPIAAAHPFFSIPQKKTKVHSTPDVIFIDSSPQVRQEELTVGEVKVAIDVDKQPPNIRKTISCKATAPKNASGAKLRLSSNFEKKIRSKKLSNTKGVDIKKSEQPIMKRLAQRAQNLKQSSDTSSESLASIFGATKASDVILAEHRALEFSIKQREKIEKECERRRRRHEAHAQVLAPEDSMSSTQVKFKTTTTYPLDLRFYSPSHVFAPFRISPRVEKEKSWVIENVISNAQSRLREKERHFTKPLIDEQIKDCNLLPSTLNKRSLAADRDLISKIISTKLEVADIKLIDGKLWVEKHSIRSIPADVVGKSNQGTSIQMLRFVDEWKLERQKAHVRRAEKQEALKMTRRKKQSPQCEDIWSDSEEESSLASIFLLTGPPGSGKTSLVHAVARQSDCFVIEINTTVKRSGQALKHAIEEATQSDSTLEMMKRKNNEATFDFADTDDDESKDATEKRAAVPVVLIDEVDNLFEEAGDVGFWTALKTVAKKAQCPVFLTANRVPEEFLRASIRHMHCDTFLAEPSECASRLCRILKDEGFQRIPGCSEHELFEELVKVAECCNCDLRRILNSLEVVLSHQQQFPVVNEKEIKTCTKLMTAATVEISNVSPKQVSSDEPTLLTIKGRGFKSMTGKQCSVLIGSALSLGSHTVDDNTILAVCPPCSLPNGVNKYGHFEGTFQECLSCRFKSIAVVFDCFGVSSSSISNVTCNENCDGSVATAIESWKIEYSFPGVLRSFHSGHQESDSIKDSDEETDKENVFCSNKFKHGELPAADEIARNDVNLKCGDELILKAKHLIDNAVATFAGCDEKAIQTRATHVPASKQQKVGSCKAIEHDAMIAALDSDVAFLQDHLGGTPFLAGASRGFGSDLVDGGSHGSTATNEVKLTKNTKPPNIERLIASGWNEEYCFFGNSDAYMVHPFTARDRQLLEALVSGSRGMSISLEDRLSHTAYDITKEINNEIETPRLGGSTTAKAAQVVSDEDMLLPQEAPVCFMDLPVMVSELSYCKRSHDCVANELLTCRKRAKLAAKNSFLSSVLSDEDHVSCFRRGVTRVVDSVLPNDRLDEAMILDYFPFLSRMASSERISDFAFDKQLPEDKSAGRRVTRRNKAVHRKHYFASLNVALQEGHETAQVLGSKFADNILRF